jgi:rubrerythrin
MPISSTANENTGLDNSTYNILRASENEADFLYSAVDKYMKDAEQDGKKYLIAVWNEIRRDKKKHLGMLKECLEEEVKE